MLHGENVAHIKGTVRIWANYTRFSSLDILFFIFVQLMISANFLESFLQRDFFQHEKFQNKENFWVKNEWEIGNMEVIVNSR